MGRAGTASFEKYEGLGNDFVVVDAANERDVSVEWAQSVCDRRRGVGADGVLVVLPPATAGADARMRVINPDGSIAEMCGNGLRCAALHVARSRAAGQSELAIDTDAGLLRCVVDRRGDEATVFADLGVAQVGEDVVVEAEGERVSLTRVDVGNPHAISFRDITRAQFERLGPALSTSPAFERGTNVEFVAIGKGVLSTGAPCDALDVLVWERGAGPTLACGTGACAAVAAARAKGLIAPEGTVLVRLPGGGLEISLEAKTGRATQRGPARRVFSGHWIGGDS